MCGADAAAAPRPKGGADAAAPPRAACNWIGDEDASMLPAASEEKSRENDGITVCA
jgi:hypothetical protein